jgi:hypothetical protein
LTLRMLRDSADGLKCSTEAARAKLPISANTSAPLSAGSPEPCVQYVGALRRTHWTCRESNQIIHAAQTMTGAAGCVAQP